MRIAQVTCPACGALVFSKSVDMIVQCDRCGELHTREAVPQVISYDVAEPQMQGTGEKVYIPIWSMDVVFHIDKVENKNDPICLDGRLCSEIKNEGKLKMYVPAHSLDPIIFKRMTAGMAERPPVAGPGKLDPKVRRLPCIVKSGIAEKMAHFLFIASVAEKRGILLHLDYRLTVVKARLIYLTDFVSPDDQPPD